MFDEIDRIEMILNELLMLAKPQLHKKGWVDLKTIVSDVITLFQPQAIMSDIQLFEKDLHPAWVYGDPYQLKQAFINFLKNALESMETGGTVTLTMSECDRFHSVKITDEGCGISEDMFRKIGEPFYSTKEKDTGLGMMVSRKIIESHGGAFKITSQVDIGTVVELCFSKSVKV